MNETNIQRLIVINEKIKNLKAVKCGIKHEKVQIDDETNLPISKYIGETVYDRIGFCDEELRKQRISCSHTTAPEILHDALNLLDAESEKVDNLRIDLMDIIFQIHQLDHRKSDAEKHLAILIEKKLSEQNDSSELDINTAKEEIKKIVIEHDGKVDKIDEIRNQIVVEIESVIS